MARTQLSLWQNICKMTMCAALDGRARVEAGRGTVLLGPVALGQRGDGEKEVGKDRAREGNRKRKREKKKRRQKDRERDSKK